MKKLRMVVMLLLCVSLLSACSKTGGYKWLPGNIMGPHGSMVVTEFKGNQATTTVNGVQMSVYYEKRIMYCSHNFQNVQEDRMTAYRKGKYFTSYQDTVLTVYHPLGDGWVEGRISVEGNAVSDLAAQVYDALSNIILSDSIKQINIADVMVLNVEGQEFVMRLDEVIIPQVIRIKVNDGSKMMTDMADISGTKLAHMSTTDFDYYELGEYLIQAAKGTDLSMLLIFK